MVPSTSADSGMMLLVVPATTRPTVRMPGSNTSIRRLTMVCNASTISHAMGTGSSARDGSLAWPPRPTTVIVSLSLDAISGPGRETTIPVGAFGVRWMA